MKKWTIGSPDEEAVRRLMSQSDLSALSCAVLVSQGCLSAEQASMRMGCDALSDPFLLCDMREAANTVTAALDEGRRICIYGDYDCDGVMATAILYTYLSEMGADVTWRIPERSEGYGLNPQAVREMHEDGVQLILTVDNGISANEEAKLIRDLGMELVITDHHQPGAVLPEAAAVVDAHREDNISPFRLYCGAGIALLLVAAMNEGDLDFAMEQCGDLAAIATIADVVSLTGENRYLVQCGLDYLENTERPGLRALREAAGLAAKPLTSTNIAFGIAPRINAAGRLASPRLAVELLLEEDPAKAKALAEELCSINVRRKSCEEEILYAVRSRIAEEPDLLHERVLVFDGEGWHAGVIGITASRLQERYGKPCFMISVKDGVGHGSARSFGDFSVFACLTACGDLLEKFGGHPAAGGFTIKAENIPAFRERIAAYAAAHHPVMPVMELRAAFSLKPEHLDAEAAETLLQLEPFGCDNPEPCFLAENLRIREIRPLSSGVHTKFTADLGGAACEALLFRTAPERTGLRVGDLCHMMVRLSVSEWMGRKKVTLMVQDYRKAGVNQNKLLAAMQTYDCWRRHERLEPAYLRAVCPSRKDCVAVWNAVPGREEVRIDRLAQTMYMIGMNYCKMRICLDVFAELGLMEITGGETGVRRSAADHRVNLSDSAILNNIQKEAGV